MLINFDAVQIFQSFDAVNEQHTIQVIDLVMNDHRIKTLENALGKKAKSTSRSWLSWAGNSEKWSERDARKFVLTNRS